MLKFWNALDGFTGWALPTAKVGQVSFSGPHQGLLAHIERYRNSPVMHKTLGVFFFGQNSHIASIHVYGIFTYI